MNELLKMMLGKLATEKGRDANRTLVFLISLYTAWLVTNLDKRVAVLESRLSVARVSDLASTNDVASHPFPFELFP